MGDQLLISPDGQLIGVIFAVSFAAAAADLRAGDTGYSRAGF